MRRWRLIFFLCMAVAGLAAMARAQAAEPALRVQVQARQPVLVGQQVQIDVTVVAPNFFTSAPPFPTLSVPGAIVTMPDERAVNGVEQEGGETLATIRKSYAFTAQQPGDFTLPPVKIDFSYGGDDGKPRTANLTLPPTRISAQLPEGAAAAASAGLPVAQLTIQQHFDRETKGLKAGDALVRSVEIAAARTQAMMIPPPHFEAPPGVRVFMADPVLSDRGPDGDPLVGGRRTDRATYVFEKAGRYTLPAIEVKWFDPATRQPGSAQAPAVTVQVAAAAHGGERIAPQAPAFGGDDAQPRRRIAWASVAVQIAGLILLAALSWWVHGRWPRWQVFWQARRKAQAASDDAMFRQVLEASTQGDARRTHAALLAWCAAHAGAPPRAWAANLRDPASSAQIEALERQLYAGGQNASGAAWSGTTCAQALRAAHREWRAARPVPPSRRWWQRHALGPLNPLTFQNTKT